jgi:hypothetical protein
MILPRQSLKIENRVLKICAVKITTKLHNPNRIYGITYRDTAAVP